MRWIGRLDDDRGATIVFVALLTVVLIGFVGLAVDAAAMFAERRELSRAADAAALAIAEECALDLPLCDASSAWGMAEQYADANSDDGHSQVTDLDLDLTAQSVTVTLGSEDRDGNPGYGLFFMRALGFDRADIGAAATAQWGYAAAAAALPLIISDCEWDKYQDTGEAEVEVTIFFHDGGTTDDCAAQAGQDADLNGRLPGGFGWLLTTGECSAEVIEASVEGEEEHWVTEDPGASPSRGCSPEDLYQLIFEEFGAIIALPYFSDVWGTGSSGTYKISGVGAFKVTGYNFGGQYRVPDALSAPCSGDERCISGFFTEDVIHNGPIGGQDRGLVVIKLAG